MFFLPNKKLTFSAVNEGYKHKKTNKKEKELFDMLIENVGVDRESPLSINVIKKKVPLQKCWTIFSDLIEQSKKNYPMGDDETNLLNKDQACVKLITTFYKKETSTAFDMARLLTKFSPLFMSPLEEFFMRIKVKEPHGHFCPGFFCDMWVFKKQNRLHEYKNNMEEKEFAVFLSQMKKNENVLTTSVLIDDDWDLAEIYGVKRDLVDTTGNTAVVVTKDHIVLFRIKNKFFLKIGKKKIKARFFVFGFDKKNKELTNVIDSFRDTERKNLGNYLDFVRHLLEIGFTIEEVYDTKLSWMKEGKWEQNCIYFYSDDSVKKQISFVVPISWERKKQNLSIQKKAKNYDDLILLNLEKKTRMPSNVHISNAPEVKNGVIKQFIVGAIKKMKGVF